MKHIYLILILFIPLIACEKENDNNEYTEYLSENSVSTEIDFFPVELYEHYYETDTPSLKIHFITSEIFPCINYHLASTQFIKENELIVRFDSIQKYTICLTAIGPAEAYVDLPNGITSLVLINGQTIDRYQVSITDEIVEINPITESYTTLKYTKTFRYPVNTFAYICGTNLDNTHLYHDFLNILLDSTSVIEYKFNGDGRIPYPDSSSGHWSDNASKFFKYENVSEFDKVGELLKNFTHANISPNDGVGISLLSWDNRKYKSWMMD